MRLVGYLKEILTERQVASCLITFGVGCKHEPYTRTTADDTVPDYLGIPQQTYVRSEISSPLTCEEHSPPSRASVGIRWLLQPHAPPPPYSRHCVLKIFMAVIIWFTTSPALLLLPLPLNYVIVSYLQDCCL